MAFIYRPFAPILIGKTVDRPILIVGQYGAGSFFLNKLDSIRGLHPPSDHETREQCTCTAVTTIAGDADGFILTKAFVNESDHMANVGQRRSCHIGYTKVTVLNRRCGGSPRTGDPVAEPDGEQVG